MGPSRLPRADVRFPSSPFVCPFPGELRSNDLPPEGRWRGGPSALKSALQKAVRLGRGACAVRAALHLVKEEGGPAQLLRRLSVVCVEDAILHPGLPLVVWLMAAQVRGRAGGCDSPSTHGSTAWPPRRSAMDLRCFGSQRIRYPI